MRPPKGTSLRQTALFEPSCMILRRLVRPGREPRKPEKMKTKKSQVRYISCMHTGETPLPIEIIIILFRNLPDVINYAKFCFDCIRGF
jgi:hypothetical protein